MGTSFAKPPRRTCLRSSNVEAANWDETQKQMRTPRAVVEERVANNPACNLAVADAETGACRGGVYFQRVARRDVAGSTPWRDKELGRGPPDAPWVQLMDIHVCQAFSRSLGRAVGNELREFVLNCALVHPGTEGVCAVTRTRGFRRTQTRTNETYESYVTRGDGSHDRGLLFHVGGGARVVRAVQNWRPADVENDGKGTLIEYPLGEIDARGGMPRSKARRRRSSNPDAESTANRRRRRTPPW